MKIDLQASGLHRERRGVLRKFRPISMSVTWMIRSSGLPPDNVGREARRTDCIGSLDAKDKIPAKIADFSCHR
jgi:hypothetical protein